MVHPQPIYFMTEDDVSRGFHQINLFSGKPYGAVPEPSNIEAVITPLPTGSGGAPQLWKLNHYYEPGDPATEPLTPGPGPVFELHNLSTDPEERHNLANEATEVLAQLQALFVAERHAKRKQPHQRRPQSAAL
jgi:hypothetical protein